MPFPAALSHAERRSHAVEEHRDEGLALLALLRLLDHPVGLNRMLRPGHDHATRLLQRPTDMATPSLARGDAPVPEHRPAARLKCHHHRSDPRLILAGITEKDIWSAHA